ncbi:MAG: ribbon-helix-helix protein, CopG family [Armatimonadetes bacterium]|nr:ribbon-helix-helix protein, CopG family [Armatimonadota bacterium]
MGRKVGGPMAFVRVTIHLTDEQHRLLKAEAARRGMSMSAVLRELVDREMPARRDDAATAAR